MVKREGRRDRIAEHTGPLSGPRAIRLLIACFHMFRLSFSGRERFLTSLARIAYSPRDVGGILMLDHPKRTFDWSALIGAKAADELRRCWLWCAVLAGAFVLEMVTIFATASPEGSRVGDTVNGAAVALMCVCVVAIGWTSIRAQIAVGVHYGLRGRDAWSLSLRGPDMFLVSLAVLGLEPPAAAVSDVRATARRSSVDFDALRAVVVAAGGGTWEDLLGQDGYRAHQRSSPLRLIALALLISGAAGAFALLFAVAVAGAPAWLSWIPVVPLIAAIPLRARATRLMNGERQAVVKRFRLPPTVTPSVDVRSPSALVFFLATRAQGPQGEGFRSSAQF
jgi:hypothetical protein